MGWALLVVGVGVAVLLLSWVVRHTTLVGDSKLFLTSEVEIKVTLIALDAEGATFKTCFRQRNGGMEHEEVFQTPLRRRQDGEASEAIVFPPPKFPWGEYHAHMVFARRSSERAVVLWMSTGNCTVFVGRSQWP